MKSYKIIELNDEGTPRLLGTGQAESLTQDTAHKMIIDAVIPAEERDDWTFAVIQFDCDDNERVAHVVFEGDSVEYILVQE